MSAEKVKCTSEQLKSAQCVLLLGCLAELFDNKTETVPGCEAILARKYSNHVELIMSDEGAYTGFDWELLGPGASKELFNPIQVMTKPKDDKPPEPIPGRFTSNILMRESLGTGSDYSRSYTSPPQGP